MACWLRLALGLDVYDDNNNQFCFIDLRVAGADLVKTGGLFVA